MSMITRVWADQPGSYFCISSKIPDEDGSWHDEFFTRSQFKLVPRYIEELKKEKPHRNIYWCPHGFEKGRRLARYAVLPKLLWADLDEVDPRELGDLRPTIAWESSPGRYAALWKLEGILDEDVTNQRLTYHIGADHGGWDLTQVLRVPGTRNYKYEDEPRVKILWQDGPIQKLSAIKKKLPAPKKKKGTAKNDPNSIFKKYRSHLSPYARRELLNGKPRRGKRSEVFWKLVNEMVEVGASEEECFAILWASPWNKFAGRNGGEEQLAREIDKVYNNKMSGVNPQADYEKEAQIPKRRGDDDETEEERKARIAARFMGAADNPDVDWVLYPYLARKHITSIEGDPAVGKSWITLAMAASIAEGRHRIPDDGWEDTNQRGSVFYFDRENETGSVAIRMVDSDMITQNLQDPHSTAPFFHITDRYDLREEETIDDIVELVNETLEFYQNKKNYETRPSLIVFDTFVNFAGETDTNSQKDVIMTLDNMKELAVELDCAVVIIRHYGKTKHQNAMHQAMGSTQFSATCRCMIGVHHHPDDPDQRVVTLSKSSLARDTYLRTLTYGLESVYPGASDIKKRDRTKMLWGDWVDLTFTDIMESMNDKAKRDKENKQEREDMKQLLERVFEIDPATGEAGKMDVTKDDIEREFERAGLPIKNLADQLRRLGYKQKGSRNHVFFRKTG